VDPGVEAEAILEKISKRMLEFRDRGNGRICVQYNIKLNKNMMERLKRCAEAGGYSRRRSLSSISSRANWRSSEDAESMRRSPGS